MSLTLALTRVRLDVVTLAMTAAAAAEKREMYKVVLVGNFQVGKTSIFYRMKNNTYPPPQDVTGIDRCVCNVEGQGKTLQVRLQGRVVHMLGSARLSV